MFEFQFREEKQHECRHAKQGYHGFFKEEGDAKEDRAEPEIQKLPPYRIGVQALQCDDAKQHRQEVAIAFDIGHNLGVHGVRGKQDRS